MYTSKSAAAAASAAAAPVSPTTTATGGNSDNRIEIAWTPITQEVCDNICQLILEDDDVPAHHNRAASLATAPLVPGGRRASTVHAAGPIRVVDLIENRLGPNMAATICTALESSLVEELLLRFNNVGRMGCDAVASVLNVSNRLRYVDLRGNRLTPPDIRRVMKSVALSTSLQRLGLSNNDLRAEGAALIAAALEKNSFLTALDLSMNSLGEEGGVAIAALLAIPGGSLRELSLWGNRLGPNGIRAVCEAIAEGKKGGSSSSSVGAGDKKSTASSSSTGGGAGGGGCALQKLSLGNNSGTDLCCVYLQTLLEKNRTLTSLELRSNGITSQGVSTFVAGLAHNSSLQTLALSANPIGAHGADALVKTLLHHPSLTSLDVAGCGLKSEGAARFAGLIAASTVLQDLTLSDNEVTDEGCASLSKALQAPSKSLRSLDLTSNAITMTAVTEMLEAVESNPRLAHLALQGNIDIQRTALKKLDDLMIERRAMLHQQAQEAAMYANR